MIVFYGLVTVLNSLGYKSEPLEVAFANTVKLHVPLCFRRYVNQCSILANGLIQFLFYDVFGKIPWWYLLSDWLTMYVRKIVYFFRAANVRHSHEVFLKFSIAIFKSSDSLHLDCIKSNLFMCFCRSFVCICLSLEGEYMPLSSR